MSQHRTDTKWKQGKIVAKYLSLWQGFTNSVDGKLIIWGRFVALAAMLSILTRA